MSTNAERQRRYRRHKAGDHLNCLPETCESAGQRPVTPDVTAVTPPGERGAALWADMKGDGLPPASRVLLEEACRIVDRLDKLDRLLGGDADSWVSLVEDRGDPERLVVVIDRPLAEARQQATALKQLLAELRAAGGALSAPLVTGKEVAGVVDLAGFAATRSSKSTG